MLFPALLLALGCRHLDEGAVSYVNGDPSTAIARWEDVRSAGNGSAGVLYNLGCAYREQGQLGRAIAAWRGARELCPRDADIAHNLALARGEVVGGPLPAPSRAGWMMVVAPREVEFAGTILAVSASVLLVLLARGRVVRRTLNMAVGSVLLMAGVWLGAIGMSAVRAEFEHPIAVAAEETPVRVDAMPHSATAFFLPAGAEVRVETTRESFRAISTGDGRQGWVARDALILVTP